MIKKVLILIVVCVLLLPAQALADDGPAFIDTREFLSITLKADKKSAAIGEDIEVTLTMKNNTSYPIDIYRIYELFENTFNYKEYYNEANNDSLKHILDYLIINAGEKAELVINTKVPDNIDWYIKDGKFYANIQIGTEYGVQYDSDDNDWWLFSPIHEPLPIEITNIYDGSKLVQLKVEEKENIFYFPVFNENTDSDYSEKFAFSELYTYSSKISNTVSIKNISEENISNIMIMDSQDSRKRFESIDSNQVINENYILYENYLLKNIPEKIDADYKVQFVHNGSYYGMNIAKEYPVKILYPPEVKIDLLDFTADTTSPGYDYAGVIKVAAITNTTENPISNLYFDTEGNKLNEPVFYNDPKNIIPKLVPSQTVYLPVKNEINLRNWSYYVGYITENSSLYFWRLHTDSNRADYSDILYVAYDYYVFHFFDMPTYLVPLSEKPEVTSQTLQTPTATGTPRPITTPKPTKQPPPEPTDSPAIEITDVKKSSSIPFWVWYVLAVAVVAGAVLTVTLRRKNKDKFE